MTKLLYASSVRTIIDLQKNDKEKGIKASKQTNKIPKKLIKVYVIKKGIKQ